MELGVSLALSASLSVHCHPCLPGVNTLSSLAYVYLTLFSLPCLSFWGKHAVKLGVCLPHSLFTAMLVFLGKHAVKLGAVCLTLCSLPSLSSWGKHAVKLGICLALSASLSIFTAILVFLG